MKITVEIVDYKSKKYYKALAIRDELLRQPLGLKFTEAELAEEKSATHIVATLNKQVVGCLVLKPQPDNSVKMCQVAIIKKYQFEGLGRCLVEYSEEVMLKHKHLRVEVSSRQSALEFYQKLGYWINGPEFVHLGIKHYNMVKNLE